jgi:hypothetical protein
MEVFSVLGIIAVFGVLLYFMFVTRRTVLRVFGWAVFLFPIGMYLINPPSSSHSASDVSAKAGAETTKIINDLRALRGAAFMFHEEFKTWPLPGQEASLDAYIDRPMALAEPPRYAKVMLATVSGDADDLSELYVGVELIPERNGMEGIQQKLAGTANNSGLLQQPVSGDIYKSGPSVYMRVQLDRPDGDDLPLYYNISDR